MEEDIKQHNGKEKTRISSTLSSQVENEKVVIGSDLLPCNRSNEFFDNQNNSNRETNSISEEGDSSIELAEAITLRTSHDFSGLCTHLSLNKGSHENSELPGIIDKFIYKFSVYRDMLHYYILGGPRGGQINENQLLKYLDEISKSKRIRFIPEIELSKFEDSIYILSNLLQLAIELSPFQVNILKNSIRVELQPDILTHPDVKKILQEYEYNPGPIETKKRFAAYKNIFVIIFLNYLYENQKTLVISQEQPHIFYFSVRK